MVGEGAGWSFRPRFMVASAVVGMVFPARFRGSASSAEASPGDLVVRTCDRRAGGRWGAVVALVGIPQAPYLPNAVREVKVSATAPSAVAPGAPDKDLKPAPWSSISRGTGRPAGENRQGRGRRHHHDPKFNGKWTWKDGSTLVFEPESHWPPDTKLTHSTAALAKDLTLDHPTLTVKTPRWWLKSAIFHSTTARSIPRSIRWWAS